MTRSKLDERLSVKGRPRLPQSVWELAVRRANYFLEQVETVEQKDARRWPSTEYQTNPLGFARQVLGVDLWGWQLEFILAILNNRRVAVAGGRKIGKDFAVAVLALWWYCSFPDARCIITAVTDRQINDILWRQIKQLIAGSGVCLDCKRANKTYDELPCPHSRAITDEPGLLPRSGLKAHDGRDATDLREIKGFTAKEAEAVQGISGGRLLYIFDEASGVPDPIYIAVNGNIGGGDDNRIAAITNPTQNTGWCHDAFHGASKFWKTFQVSSLDSPNVKTGKVIVPGLATRLWVDEMAEMWGRESAYFKIHVEGQFVVGEDEKALKFHEIQASTERWSETRGEGRLVLGLDPAGPEDGSDESAFALRRGNKIIELWSKPSMSEEAICLRANELLAQHRVPDETPLIVIDSLGVGSPIFYRLRAGVDRGGYQVIPIRSSDKAIRARLIYDRIRDELWANLAHWIRAGGAIPPNVRLQKALHAPAFAQMVTGLRKVTQKTEIKKLIGRSPDDADAVALAVWPSEGQLQGGTAPEPSSVVDPYDLAGQFDEVGGQDVWWPST